MTEKVRIRGTAQIRRIFLQTDYFFSRWNPKNFFFRSIPQYNRQVGGNLNNWTLSKKLKISRINLLLSIHAEINPRLIR